MYIYQDHSRRRLTCYGGLPVGTHYGSCYTEVMNCGVEVFHPDFSEKVASVEEMGVFAFEIERLARADSLRGVRLSPVHIWHARFLYELLADRPQEANISHKDLPPFWRHVLFMLKRPYWRWYLIEKDGEKVGATYIVREVFGGVIVNYIGIFVLRKFHGQGIGPHAVKMLMAKHPCDRFCANVSPNNPKSIKMFEKLGFKLCQHTFEWRRG